MIPPHEDSPSGPCPKSLSAGAVERIGKWVRHNPVLACLTALGAVGSLVLAQQLLTNIKMELSLLATLKGNTNIRSVVFSPDGKTLATAETDHTIKLWDAATGQERAVLKEQPVLRGGGLDGTMHFSPDSATLAIAGYSNNEIALKLWNVATGQERATLKGVSRIRSVAFSPKGETAAVEGLGDAITLRDAATGQKRAALQTKEVFRFDNGIRPAVSVSPDGKTIVTAGKEGTIKVWETATGRERATLQRPVKDLLKIVISPDGKNLATLGGEDRSAKLWDAATGRERARLVSLAKSAAFRPDAAFSSDGKALVTHDNNTLRLWDVASLNQRRMIPQVVYWYFSPDGKRLTTGLASTSKLWDAATGKQLAVFAGVNRPVVFSPDGKILATANEEAKDGKTPDGIVKLWDAATGKLLETLQLKDQGKEHISLDFTPDGKTLVTRGWPVFAGGGAIRLWDVATRKERAALTGLSSVGEHKISPDGKTLALRAGNSVQLWDMATGKKLATLDKTDTLQPLGVMLFSPDGKTLATGGNNDNIKLWEAATGQLRVQLEWARANLNAVVFNPDSKTLATPAMTNRLGMGATKLWDVATGRELATVPGVESVVFSPESNTLVTIGTDVAVQLWDVATAQARAALASPIAGIRYMRFSPDGKLLATMIESGELRGQSSIETVQLWDPVTGKELATLKGVGEAIFSPDGKVVVTTQRNGIKLWDAATGRERIALWNKWPLTFSPDSKLLVTVSDGRVSQGKVQLWDAATGAERTTLEGAGEAFLDPDGKVQGMRAAFSPDGKLLATQSREAVQLWYVATAKQRATLKGTGEVAFSPDGKFLVTEIRGGIKLWDTATGKERTTITGQMFKAFSPDSSLLATSDEREIRLWSLSPKK